MNTEYKSLTKLTALSVTLITHLLKATIATKLQGSLNLKGSCTKQNNEPSIFPLP